MTRVTPSMLPPTIITAPTSELARPNPASIAVRSEYRMSHSSVIAAGIPLTPSERSWSWYSIHASSTACLASAAMIGRMSRVCAMTIAGGVNSSPYWPSGPARDSNRYTTSPTTTGGSPINALSRTTKACRPGKRATATAAPIGNASSVANSTALRLTFRLSATISIKLLSHDVIRPSAPHSASANVFREPSCGPPSWSGATALLRCGA